MTGDQIEFHVNEQLKCSGSPLLNDNYNVVGIHTGIGTDEKSNKNASEYTYEAINIKTVLESFKSFILRRFGQRPENEIWLEKLKEIKNEIQYIGSGGYGKVYKFKDNGIDLALKVVEGFGNTLIDYDKESKALERREYYVVSKMNSHPRIILFFGLVRDDRETKIMLIMEYMAGGSLGDKIKKVGGPLIRDSVFK